MFARVLFATDLSAHADSVLACLTNLKSAGLREVILLSVIRIEYGSPARAAARYPVQRNLSPGR